MWIWVKYSLFSPSMTAWRTAKATRFPSRDGTTLVLRNSPTFEVLAKNTLDDGIDASPALVDNEIYMRSYKYLYAIGGN